MASRGGVLRLGRPRRCRQSRETLIREGFVRLIRSVFIQGRVGWRNEESKTSSACSQSVRPEALEGQAVVPCQQCRAPADEAFRGRVREPSLARRGNSSLGAQLVPSISL